MVPGFLRNNCLWWALKMRIRFGGQVCMLIPSENYPGPHFGWVAGKGHPACIEGEVYWRAPINPVKRLIPPPNHPGYIQLVGALNHSSS